MANHKSALKRIRSSQTRRLRNRYYSKTMRNAVRKFISNQDKKKAEEDMPKIASMIDKLAKRNVIHKNKAGNLKSRLSRHLNKLS
ncbi:MAG: 30S ribosomal protein S20 [Bacteroidetes bacterium]|nr:MAG: 30S ribosomal protein S20 [Bacteroidota bacterium]